MTDCAIEQEFVVVDSTSTSTSTVDPVSVASTNESCVSESSGSVGAQGQCGAAANADTSLPPAAAADANVTNNETTTAGDVKPQDDGNVVTDKKVATKQSAIGCLIVEHKGDILLLLMLTMAAVLFACAATKSDKTKTTAATGQPATPSTPITTPSPTSQVDKDKSSTLPMNRDCHVKLHDVHGVLEVCEFLSQDYNKWVTLDFTDAHAVSGQILGLRVWSGDALDAIQVRYGNVWAEKHGGSLGSMKQFDLSAGEHIVQVELLSSSQELRSLKVVTSLGRTHEWTGKTSYIMSSVRFDGHLLYIAGKERSLLVGLVLHFERPSTPALPTFTSQLGPVLPPKPVTQMESPVFSTERSMCMETVTVWVTSEHRLSMVLMEWASIGSIIVSKTTETKPVALSYHQQRLLLPTTFRFPEAVTLVAHRYYYLFLTSSDDKSSFSALADRDNKNFLFQSTAAECWVFAKMASSKDAKNK